MDIIKMHGECLEENTFILPKGKDCIIIDPGASSKRILKVLDFLGLQCVAVLITHGHFDHIIGAFGLQNAGAKIFMHQDADKMVNSSRNLAKSIGMVCERFCADYMFTDDESLNISGFEVQVINTPGHSDGGVCFVIEDNLFTGDTLFRDSYGATHFPTGDYKTLKNSIINKLFCIDKNLKVYSGHDTEPRYEDNLIENTINEKIVYAAPCSTLDYERKNNPIFMY